MLLTNIFKKYNNPNVRRLSVPMGILGNFEYKYVTYNDEGKVISGHKTLISAIKKCNKEGLYLTRILN